MTAACYHIEDVDQIYSPALILFRELMEDNLDRMIAVAGDVRRMRPHCKTHKLPEVTKIELGKGIVKHKAATLAEAEMLADAGVKDIFLAYNLVGPNIGRAVQFVQKFPDVMFAATCDHPQPIAALSDAMQAASCQMQLLLDINTGLKRTGLEVGDQAARLYAQIADSPGLVPGGLHVYDGHNHQTPYDEREAAVLAAWGPVIEFRDELVRTGLPVPRIVAGGTGTFPIYAKLDEPTLELSPGTTVFHDAGYDEIFPDMKFNIATMILTRVISRPAPDRVTFDVGTKACASDPPKGRRLVFPDIPDADQVLQNEEHLVVVTQRADEFSPGDVQLAIPRHICPTTALHKQIVVVAGGKVVDRWDIVARDRQLTI